MPIFIRADAVQDAGDGVFIIGVRERSLTDRQREVLDELFPRLSERAYHLLDQEALLSSLMTEEEANAHMARGADPIPVPKLPKLEKRGFKVSSKPHPAPAKLKGDALDADDDTGDKEDQIPY